MHRNNFLEKAKNTYEHAKNNAKYIVLGIAMTATACTKTFTTDTYQVTNTKGEYVDAKLVHKNPWHKGPRERLHITNSIDDIVLYNNDPSTFLIDKMTVNSITYDKQQPGMQPALEQGAREYATIREQVLSHRAAEATSALGRGKP